MLRLGNLWTDNDCALIKVDVWPEKISQFWTAYSQSTERTNGEEWDKIIYGLRILTFLTAKDNDAFDMLRVFRP